METLEQMRSRQAWGDATRRFSESPKAFDGYRNCTKAAPVMIMDNGLMTTLAFYQSRKKGEDKPFVKDMVAWLSTRKILDHVSIGVAGKVAPRNTPTDPFTLTMERLLHSPSDTYQQATSEVLAYLRWLRQFADAIKASVNP